jgi:MFS family permease
VLVGFNSTATNIALDDIQAGFSGASAADVGWGVAGFFIGTAAFMPLAGRLADRIGRKRMFQLGLLLFALSAVFSAVAPTVLMLNLSRVLQAIAGAALLPSSLALVLPLFPESRRSTAVGLWSAAGPLGAGVAPAAAALILAAAGWRAVYLVSAPVALLMFWGGWKMLRELPIPPNQQRLDLVGAAGGTVAVAAVVTAIMQGRVWGYSSPITITVAVIGVAALGLFVANSSRHPEPLLNLHLLRRRGVFVANTVNFLGSITSQPLWIVWPLFMKNVWNFSTLQVGLGVTLGPVTAGCSTLVFSRLADRIGAIGLCRLGTMFQMAAVSWHLTQLGSEVNFWSDFAPGILMYGLGWGMSIPLLNGVALEWVEEKFFAETNGLYGTLRYASGAIGTAMVFALLTTTRGIEALPYYERILAVFLVATTLSAMAMWIPVGKAPPRNSWAR